MTFTEAALYGSSELLQVTSSPLLDSHILLEHILNLPLARVILSPDYQLSSKEIKEFQKLIKKRKSCMPIAYIIRKKEFFGLEFTVTSQVLIPRPDSEILVDAAISYVKANFNNESPLTLIDVGTGTGALIISILSHLSDFKNLSATGLDISHQALSIAEKNRIKLLPDSTFLKFIKNDILSRRASLKCDVAIANPPYIPTSVIPQLSRDVKDFEPRLALDGGQDGLIFYKAISKNIHGKAIICEIGKGQQENVQNIFSQNGYRLTDSFKDYNEILRVLVFER